MNIDKWIAGYKVRVMPWIDGANYYLNIAYYPPGANISKSPEAEWAFLIPIYEEPKLKTHLHSIVTGLADKYPPRARR
jgi:hypothetical protein